MIEEMASQHSMEFSKVPRSTISMIFPKMIRQTFAYMLVCKHINVFPEVFKQTFTYMHACEKQRKRKRDMVFLKKM